MDTFIEGSARSKVNERTCACCSRHEYVSAFIKRRTYTLPLVHPDKPAGALGTKYASTSVVSHQRSARKSHSEHPKGWNWAASTTIGHKGHSSTYSPEQCPEAHLRNSLKQTLRGAQGTRRCPETHLRIPTGIAWPSHSRCTISVDTRKFEHLVHESPVIWMPYSCSFKLPVAMPNKAN